jgi:hypothetical protein
VHPCNLLTLLLLLLFLCCYITDPMGTTIFSKAVVIPGQVVQPECKIPLYTDFQGTKIFTPCL